MDANITSEDIARALRQRRWRLAFAPPLEARFEADTQEGRCRRLIRQNWIGLAIYNSFLLGDWLLIHDIFVVSAVLHLLVMSPIMGAVNVIISRRPSPWFRETVLAGGIVLGTAAILGLTLLSRSPLRSSEHLSCVLVILFATTVQRIRFRYVAAACLVSLILYVAALVPFAAHDWARVVVADAVFAGAVLFSLIGCHNLEAELRLSYLLQLRDKLQHEELEAISNRDALTGVGNRRALDRALERLRPTAGRAGGGDLAVLIFDIDHFKAFNDVHGHLAGDDCLRHVAALVGSDVRLGMDRVFRFGGEEFVVLLEGTSLEEAMAVAERIRAGVERLAFRRDRDSAGVVTVSIGVAAGPLSEAGAADIIADADTALYAAKHGGRNQVRSWPNPPGAGASSAAA